MDLQGIQSKCTDLYTVLVFINNVVLCCVEQHCLVIVPQFSFFVQVDINFRRVCTFPSGYDECIIRVN